MKTCPNCNYENNDTNNFCTECGTKLETPPVRCPKCETELTNQSKFCHNCGTKLTEDSKETPISSPFGFFGRLQKTSSNDDKDYDEENDDDNNDIDWDNYEMKSEDELRAMYSNNEDEDDYCDDYDSDDEIDWDNYEMKSADELRAMFDGDNEDDEDYCDDYDEDDDELEILDKKVSDMQNRCNAQIEKSEHLINKTITLQIKFIIRQYLPQISKDHTYYDFTGTEKYPEILQKIMKNIAKDVNEEEILGFIDVTVFGKGKTGLVFTTEALYEKGPMFSSKVPYYRMTSISCNGKEITIHKTEDCGTGLVSQMNISYNDISYDIPALENCLNEIIAIVNE